MKKYGITICIIKKRAGPNGPALFCLVGQTILCTLITKYLVPPQLETTRFQVNEQYPG